jgi:hypothetical protein
MVEHACMQRDELPSLLMIPVLCCRSFRKPGESGWVVSLGRDWGEYAVLRYVPFFFSVSVSVSLIVYVMMLLMGMKGWRVEVK